MAMTRAEMRDLAHVYFGEYRFDYEDEERGTFGGERTMSLLWTAPGDATEFVRLAVTHSIRDEDMAALAFNLEGNEAVLKMRRELARFFVRTVRHCIADMTREKVRYMVTIPGTAKTFRIKNGIAENHEMHEFAQLTGFRPTSDSLASSTGQGVEKATKGYGAAAIEAVKVTATFPWTWLVDFSAANAKAKSDFSAVTFGAHVQLALEDAR